MSEKLHFIAIGGTAMAPLAVLLAGRGHEVSGSDGTLYPPMSDLLARSGIRVAEGFRAENIPERCDAVVVGNAVPKGNPEVVAMLARGLPYVSMPQAIHRYLLGGKHPLVVTGTHGKTTTSALAAWLLTAAGHDPTVLVGGELKNFGAGFRDGAGPCVVLEGDEYNASFFDRGPKFLHYAPRTLVVNNVEFDHGDLYADLDAIREAFARVIALVPQDGTIVAGAEDPNVVALLPQARGRVVTFSLGRGASFRPEGIECSPSGTEFTLMEDDRPIARLRSPLHGDHNLRNVLAACAAARAGGASLDEIARGLPLFSGVKRRLEILGERAGVTYVDDFAHHPTAVRETLRSARRRWPGRRIWAVYEPRSLTAGRRIFQAGYAEALAEADAAIVAPVFHAARLAAGDVLDRAELGRALAVSGCRSFSPDSFDEIDAILCSEARPGDVVLLMSSGDFGGLRRRVASQS